MAELIDRRMATYGGRDGSLLSRLEVWRDVLGVFTLESLNMDVMREARSEIEKLPALAFKGADHEGRKIFKAKRSKAKSPATINRYMAAISGVFTWAIEAGLTPVGWANPCWKLKRRKGEVQRVRFLDEAERTALLDACKASRYVRLYALVLTALLTGARRGELLGLTWGDVDLKAGRAQLGRTKNGDRRTLVLLPPVVEALRPFEGDKARFVFGSARSVQMAPTTFDTAWRRAVARAKLRDFRFHDLRHCFASYMAQAGKPLNVIAKAMGHRKLDMTQRYAHLTVETEAQAMQHALGGIAEKGSP